MSVESSHFGTFPQYSWFSKLRYFGGEDLMRTMNVSYIGGALRPVKLICFVDSVCCGCYSLGMKTHEILDISGDAGIKAFGRDLNELFRNAAMGMYSLITDIGRIKEERKIDVSVRSGSMEGLLVAWLNELVFHFDTYGFVGKKIDIEDFPPDDKDREAGQEVRMSASLSGEDFDRERHVGKLLIKAATYHGLEIKKKDGVWQAEIIFDI